MLESESFTIDSELRADDLIRRIEADATDGQEPRLSEAARAAGMYGFTFRLEGNSFRVRANIPLTNRGYYSPVYDGVVTPLDAGSQVSGAFRFGRGTLAFVALWSCGLALWCCAVAFIVISATGAVAKSVSLAGAVTALVIASGSFAVGALLGLFVLRLAWRGGKLARAETRALLVRAATAPPVKQQM